MIIHIVAVIRLLSDQHLGPRFDHVKIKTQLNQFDLMIAGMRTHRQEQSRTIDNRQDFDAFCALRRANLQATATSIDKGRINRRFGWIKKISFSRNALARSIRIERI